MQKRITVILLAALGASVLALPSLASAFETLHINPTPSGAKTIDGVGSPALTTDGSGSGVKLKVTCTKFSGTASFNAGGTTGSMELTYGPTCESAGIHCQSSGAATGEITSETLPFDLVTVGTTFPGKPGILVTPPASGVFAKFTCGVIVVEVKGNGVIGTITSPACGAKSSEPTIEFKASASGIQEDKKLVATTTEYTLKKGSDNAAQEASGKLTLAETLELICT